MDIKQAIREVQKYSDKAGQQVSSEIRYSAGETFKYIHQRMNEQGIIMKVDNENEKVLTLIAQYFANDIAFEEENKDSGYSLKKGLYLFGNTGCGKTKLMQAISQNKRQNYTVINCKLVGAEYAIDGEKGILQYYEVDRYYKGGIRSFCFDDLGSEEIQMHYGQKKEIMEHIMTLRYANSRVRYNTHVTSNITTDEIRKRYGSRIVSRFREMFNIIEFPTLAKDRRI